MTARPWQELSWQRLLAAAVISPLPAFYIGFAAFLLAHSDWNLVRTLRFYVLEILPCMWGFALLFILLYLMTVSRFRGRIGLMESVFAGGFCSFLLAGSFFIAVEFDLLGPLPYVVFFPGIFMASFKQPVLAMVVLGLFLVPAGALSGWIFWRIGVASAPKLAVNSDGVS